MDDGRPRGGVRQRQAKRQRSARPSVKSQLARFLVSMFAWGHMSPQMVQKIALYAKRDFDEALLEGAVLPDLDKLAELGTRGRWENNISTQLLTSIGTRLPKLHESSLPLSASVPCTFLMRSQGILLPHELFATLYRTYPRQFNDRIVQSRQQLKKNWREMEDHPAMIGHPMRERSGWAERAVPLSIHGDEVPVTGVGRSWSKSLLLISWCSLVGVGTTLEKVLLSYVVFAHMLAQGAAVDSIAAFWKVLHWSFFFLWMGVWPDRDESGVLYTAADGDAYVRRLTPLAGDATNFFFGVLWVFRNDLEHSYKCLRIGNYRALSAGPCALCPCNSSLMPWTDFNPDTAAWIAHTYSAAQWLALNPARLPILTLPGVTAVNYVVDVMHAKHMGTDMYYRGSMLFIICFFVLPHTPSRNCSMLWVMLKAAYAELGTPSRFGPLKLSMFCSTDEPHDHQPCLKGIAADVKHIGLPLLLIWDQCRGRFVDSAVLEGEDRANAVLLWQQIRLGLRLSIDIDSILDDYVDCARLPPGVRGPFAATVFNFLRVFSALGQAVIFGQRRELFNITIKSHMLAHLALQSAYINPVFGSCYSGEDFMKRMKRLGQSCARGVTARDVPRKLLNKYLVALHLLWTEDLFFK